METAKREVFNVVKLRVVMNKIREFKIKEFSTVEDAEEYLKSLNTFRPNEIYEIRTVTKEIQDEAPKMGFFKRMKLIAEIEEEIKHFENSEIDKETVMYRFKQFADFLK